MKKIIQITFIALLSLGVVSCSSTDTSESTGEYVDSSVITSKVKAKLASSDKVSALDVKVKTYKSTVQLSGFVDTEEQKYAAETIAKNIKGVQEVENDLVVKNQITNKPLLIEGL